MLLIYSERPGKRYQYVAEVLLNEISGVEIAFTINQDEFNSFAGAKINYSPTPISENEFWIKPSPLLFEETIRLQDITILEVNGFKAFFAMQEGDYPFDIFAASFYLISRYEEYLPHANDEFGRFAHTESLAFREKFLSQPLVN